jgi:hypothetical protein
VFACTEAPALTASSASHLSKTFLSKTYPPSDKIASKYLPSGAYSLAPLIF